MTDKCQVTIVRRGETHIYWVRKGLGFQALHTKEKTPLEFDCREADCGICIFKVIEGEENLSEKTFREKDFLQAMHADPRERLACQTRIMGDVTIELEF
jgi:ferredoxin